MKQPFTKKELTEYIEQRGYLADIDSMWDWYEKVDFKYPLGKCLCKIKNWKADVNLKLRTGKFGAYKEGEKPTVKKIKLYPIRGKNCSKCGMPAVYRTGGSYDWFYCAEHMPEKVKEKYE